MYISRFKFAAWSSTLGALQVLFGNAFDQTSTRFELGFGAALMHAKIKMKPSGVKVKAYPPNRPPDQAKHE